jgi:hypothetical protein
MKVYHGNMWPWLGVFDGALQVEFGTPAYGAGSAARCMKIESWKYKG